MIQSTTPPRRISRTVFVGSVPIGGGHPVVVQSMTTTDTRDPAATVRQIEALQEAGCEIVRVAVPDMDAARSLRRIVKASSVPIIADIHFDWRLAVAAIEAGAHGIRINPGNIGGKDKLRRVVEIAKERGIPIRVGVNAGSLEPELRRRYGGPCAEALVESALRAAESVLELGHEAVKISLKSSDVRTTVEAYRLAAKRTDLPLHLGVTEAGGPIQGTVKSAVALGALLLEGIGDTIRVSLTAPPVQEVQVAWEILKALRIRRRGPEIISCPTCGRCEIDLFSLARRVEEEAKALTAPIKIAVMGCVVNGPGEAREADVGVAGGKGVGIIFKRGRITKKVAEKDLFDEFWKEVLELSETYTEKEGP